MAEFVNNAETEYFLAEYANCYLGCGRAAWSLMPQMRELRRDQGSSLREKSVKALHWKIVLTLTESEKFWDFLSYANTISTTTFSNRIFTGGGELKLYNVDPQQAGFCFKRCYLDEISKQSCRADEEPQFILRFSCECDLTFNKYLTRISAGARPEQAAVVQAADIAVLRRQLLEFAGSKLNLVPGQGIALNFYPQNCREAARLKLTECKNWQFNLPREFDFILQCYTPVGEISDMEQKLYAMALELNSNTLEFDGKPLRACKVRTLEFGSLKTVNGLSVQEHTLEFTLSVQ